MEKSIYRLLLSFFAMLVLMAGCTKGTEKPKPVRPAPAPGEKIVESAPIAINPSGDNAEPLEEEPPSQDDLYQQLCSTIDTLLANNETNEAIRAVSEAQGSEELDEVTDRIFALRLRLLCHLKKIDEAKKVYTEALDRDATLAVAGFGIIYNNLISTEGTTPEDQRSWLNALLKADSISAKRLNITEWYLSTFANNSDWDGLMGAIPEKINALKSPTDAANMLWFLSYSALSRADEAAALKLLDVIESLSKTVPEAPMIAISGRTELAAKRGDAENLMALYKQSANLLSDVRLRRLLSAISRDISEQGDTDLIDKVCQYTFDTQRRKKDSIATAARIWMKVPVTRKDHGAVPIRLEELMQSKVDTKVLYSGFINTFFFTLDGNRETIKSLLEFADRLRPMLTDEKQIETIKARILEGAFVSEDYDMTIKYLEAGVHDRDKAWHTMAICKVKAHKAMKENRPRDAVTHFRAFMGYVKEWEKGEIDPTTGILHTPEMTLAYNAKRIGGILFEASDIADAKKAYAESREYYKKALLSDEVKPGSKEAELIEKEMATIPSFDRE